MVYEKAFLGEANFLLGFPEYTRHTLEVHQKSNAVDQHENTYEASSSLYFVAEEMYNDRQVYR